MVLNACTWAFTTVTNVQTVCPQFQYILTIYYIYICLFHNMCNATESLRHWCIWPYEQCDKLSVCVHRVFINKIVHVLPTRGSQGGWGPVIVVTNSADQVGSPNSNYLSEIAYLFFHARQLDFCFWCFRRLLQPYETHTQKKKPELL
jgi:hypothetical protein